MIQETEESSTESACSWEAPGGSGRGEYSLLGPLEVRMNDRLLTPGAFKLRVILAALLVQANRVVPIDTLISEIWGEDPPRTALQALRVYVSQLRRVLRPFTRLSLTTRSPGYILEVDTDEIDSYRFEGLRESGRRAETRMDLETARSCYQAALDLRRGPALGDLRSGLLLQSVGFRLDEMWLWTLQRRIDIDIRLRVDNDLVGELRELVGIHTLNEGLHARLMIAYFQAGRTTEALELYGSIRNTLIHELGMEPHRMLQTVQEAILKDDHSVLEQPELLSSL